MPLSKQDWARLDLMITGHAEKIAAALAAALNQASALPVQQGPIDEPVDKFCPDMDSLAKATGLPRGKLQAIKRASRGRPDAPFRGRGAYPSWIRRWLATRPDFAREAR